MEFIPLPVEHGRGYISLGFAFGADDDKFVYISDVSSIPTETMSVLRGFERIGWLVIDSLSLGSGSYPTHISSDEALGYARQLRPRHTLLIGMSHSFRHERDNAAFAKLRDSEGLDVQLSRDGLVIDLLADR